MNGRADPLPYSDTCPVGLKTSFVRRFFGFNPELQWKDNLFPIRSEIFGLERLESHARSLAAAQETDLENWKFGNPLKARLKENNVFLRQADASIAAAVQDGRQLTPAAQWLADNYALVDMQIRETALDLPVQYYMRLPKLSNGPFWGLPRIFGVTWAFVAHTDSHLQLDFLRKYLLAYQSVTPLTIGELWAIPITLKIVLIENLRRVVAAIMENNASRLSADVMANRLEKLRQGQVGSVSGLLEHIHPDTLSPAFVARLSHRSRGLDVEKDPVLVWLEQRLKDRGTTIDAAVQNDLREQGLLNATTQNIITSLRLISELDWTEFFEQVCLIDCLFKEYKSFTDADFASRDLYRKAIEDLAQKSRKSEIDIANIAISLASRSLSIQDSDLRKTDPGYYLLMEGRSLLEEEIEFRPTFSTRMVRAFCRRGIIGYGLIVTLLTLFFLFLPLAFSITETPFWPWLLLISVLAFFPASEAAVSCINHLLLRVLKVGTLPGLELLEGVPADMRTMVVIPALLTDEKTIRTLLERLEVHYLATHDETVHFALLTDWKDHESFQAPEDEGLLRLAVDGIRDLNNRFLPPENADRFLLLHRRRVWSDSERIWMGWERKRGKLHELNRLLRGATDTTFMADPERRLPASVKYIITLDADTRLPLETVKRLVGKLAHPLNSPRFNPDTGRVEQGYAILQPRVTPSLPVGHHSTLFQKFFSTATGIDTYSSAISDLYQDMFGEGSYAGKGIYHIDAFESALSGRVPDASLLSHDLFEGIFARAGLVSDIEVIEEFPTDYIVAAQRLHRWTRGDWQLLPWILSGITRKPLPRDRFSGISRWKMLDNLRRTLCAPFTLLALLACWIFMPESSGIWTAFVLLTVSLPIFLPILPDILPRQEWITFRNYVSVLLSQASKAFVTVALTITFLAHQSFLMVDAIIRTLTRVFITHKHLLQWIPTAQTIDVKPAGMVDYYRKMLPAPLFSVLLAGFMSWHSPEDLLLAGPLAFLWGLSPAIALWTSRAPVLPSKSRPSRTDIRTLRVTARRTWVFFETFVTSDDHMLPPDNFQEDPRPVLARRTSPTNIGLYLLCTVSARDFGWCGLQETLDRLEETFETLKKMQKYKGHFYNWYSTVDLTPLSPMYISTVDSGNLAGHLIAVAAACQEWLGEQEENLSWRAGLLDSVTIAIMDMMFHNGIRLPLNKQQKVLIRSLSRLKNALLTASEEEPEACLRNLEKKAQTIAAHAQHPFLFPDNSEPSDVTDLLYWISAPLRTIESHLRDYDDQLQQTIPVRLRALIQLARNMAQEMEFGFLRDSSRKLLSIGYQVSADTQDQNCYDLLASEARLAVFYAIAKGDIPARDWFRLGRPITASGNGAVLVSWSGSMFEYLMPSLVMRAPMGSLLEETNTLIVQHQIDYGYARNIPWGISESAYNARDMDYTYQYSNFGVPGLGLKRRLGENTVVAPYATLLAAMVDPQKAVSNLFVLEKAGARGRYGFYEALDYTPERVPEHQDVAVIRAYMAHHQGMSILAVADTVLEGVMRARFHKDPVIASAELLLQEQAPQQGVVARPLPSEENIKAQPHSAAISFGRRYHTASTPEPVTHLLSNGRYSVMLTAAGSGYSRWQGQALTRWREDATLDNFGAYIYLKNIKTGNIWSAGIQPCGETPDDYSAVFYEDRAEFSRQDGALTTTMEVLVSPEDDAEIRNITVSNAGHEVVEIDITSYMELALLPQIADLAHPAFTKLFVQTEYVPSAKALLATRRRREPNEPEIWMAHLAVCPTSVEMETNRAHFIGRGHTLKAPAAITGKRSLSGQTGTVLDPSFSLRSRVTIKPGATARISFWTMVASSRDKILELIDTHQDTSALDRIRTLAWTHAQIQLRHLDVSSADANLFQTLASSLLFAGSSLRSSSHTIVRGAAAQPILWEQGISGDLPILVLRVKDNVDIPVVHKLLVGFEYLRLKQLEFDFVILNEHPSSYLQELQMSLEEQVRALPKISDSGGSVRILRADLITPAFQAQLLSVARIVLDATKSLEERLLYSDLMFPRKRKIIQDKTTQTEKSLSLPSLPDLEFFNGYGGFAEGGRTYVVVIGPGKTTPAPWINVIANENFGFQASADGSGYTWALNSKERQITPWSNDPVSNPAGEVFYLQDEETKILWCLTAATRRDPEATYVAHHGYGYTRYERIAEGIASTLLQYVPTEDSVKLSRIQLHNLSGRSRTLSVTAYVEWLLGTSRTQMAQFVTTEIDDETGAIFAHNRWNPTYGARVAFADIGGYVTASSGDRRSFIGRNGSLDSPDAFTALDSLQGETGGGLDPCGILQTSIILPADGRVEIVFMLGDAEDTDKARHLITHYRTADLDQVLHDVENKWSAVCRSIQVKTPDRGMDILLNGWLLYQTLSSRVLARAGFYQASGAYGFRDQLQDGMALVISCPDLVHDHLLRAASRQFVEGDVQHWWLPQTGAGVRTHISDDRAWLAYCVAHYVTVSGDKAILDQDVGFLEAPALPLTEHDSFMVPSISAATASLFEHCARALDHSLSVGRHGLPLMGTGDWNDGMNRVGEHGQGESVWLGWFLHAALTAFIPLAEARGELVRVAQWKAHLVALAKALEGAWDGDWYLRAYFDDGTPLGSHTGSECQIDAISQSWSVLSGVASPERAAHAMHSVLQRLVKHEDHLILLLTPPFDKAQPDPGYIRGYPPGIRENGGQYTHGALWTVMAIATLGDGNLAHALFKGLNPIQHSLTTERALRYKLEPYVVAADIYSEPPYKGRGGWSWYTGSAGWMQRVGTENILGINIQGNALLINPCIPEYWPGFEVTLLWRNTRYIITVRNPDQVSRGVKRITMDNIPIHTTNSVTMKDDNLEHTIEVILG